MIFFSVTNGSVTVFFLAVCGVAIFIVTVCGVAVCGVAVCAATGLFATVANWKRLAAIISGVVAVVIQIVPTQVITGKAAEI
jgi:hypothetical protein